MIKLNRNLRSMAIVQTPNSKSAPKEKKKRKDTVTNINPVVNVDEIDPEMKSASQPQKRNKNPGVRVIGGRIYDSENGTTCHQCRQKTYAVYAACTNQAKTKPCQLKYCQTCLLNRYGEKTEDVVLLDKWDCPKCKGVCNCSICMKKRGYQPTGVVVQMVKAGGFTSVSDMIHVKGAQNASNYKRVKETTASPRKLSSPTKVIMITSPKKPGKENLFDGNSDSNVNPVLSVSPSVEEKPKKNKRKGSEVNNEESKVVDVSATDIDQALNKNKKKPKVKGAKAIVGDDVSNDAIEKVDGNVIIPKTKETKAKKIKGLKEIVAEKLSAAAVVKVNDVQEDRVVLDDKCDKKANQCLDDNKTFKVKRNAINLCTNFFETVIPLPTGTDLVNIAGADLPKEDAGNALQLLEFCSVFGKVLDVKKGQAEAVLRELIQGRSTRRGKFTSVIQFHVKLLSVIQEEPESESDSETPVLDQTTGNDSWLKVLKSCISNSQNILENMDCLDIAGGYDNLDSSTKLRVLVFLCDEVLGTEKIRNWIDDQNTKFKEKNREAKDKLYAAKDKEKSLKHKMMDDIAKAIIANEGVPLTFKEHDAIVSKIKNQADEAHAEMLVCKGMVPIDMKKAAAVRTEPFFSDNNGHVYWRLKGCSDKPGILLQDIGNADHTISVVDKWFEYDAEQVDLIKKHINVLRSRYRKIFKN